MTDQKLNRFDSQLIPYYLNCIRRKIVLRFLDLHWFLN